MICTPLGKLSHNEFPGSHDWEDSEEEENDWGKGEDNISVCLDWDADLNKQDRKNQEIENKRDNERKTPQNIPHIPVNHCTCSSVPPESSTEQSTKRSHEIPTEKKKKQMWDTNNGNGT